MPGPTKIANIRAAELPPRFTALMDQGYNTLVSLGWQPAEAAIAVVLWGEDKFYSKPHYGEGSGNTGMDTPDQYLARRRRERDQEQHSLVD